MRKQQAQVRIAIAKETMRNLIDAEKLHKVLDYGKPYQDKRGLGYSDEHSKFISSNRKGKIYTHSF